MVDQPKYKVEIRAASLYEFWGAKVEVVNQRGRSYKKYSIGPIEWRIWRAKQYAKRLNRSGL